VARAMCAHSLREAKNRGFRAMQFNFVIASNERAVRLWQDLGFAIVGRLPGVYEHPQKGLVDAYVMFQQL
jgi:ribosomal protein S18 acetylase RimI-like enzyme